MRSTSWRGWAVPDFEAVIRCRLPKLWLGREREAEVIAELASYLEDCADDGREPEGACNAVPWGRFGFQIRCGKENAMDRMKQIMILATAAMAVSGAIQVGCYFLGLRTFVFPTSNTAVVFQWPWLVALPLAGATGAYIARKSGVSVPTRDRCAGSCVAVVGDVCRLQHPCHHHRRSEARGELGGIWRDAAELGSNTRRAAGVGRIAVSRRGGNGTPHGSHAQRGYFRVISSNSSGRRCASSAERPKRALS